MKKRALTLGAGGAFLSAVLFGSAFANSRQDLDDAVVVLRVRGCDYFLADGEKGLFLLEWYGGYDPVKGDALLGNLGSYGLKDVYYTALKQRGKVYVDDYSLSRTRAAEKLANKCD